MSRPLRLALALLLAAVGAIPTARIAAARPLDRASAQMPVAAAEAPTCPPAGAAALRLEITSSSAKAQVHLSGHVTGRKDVTTSGGATIGYLADGVTVTVPTGSTGKAVTDVVVVDPSLAETLTIRVDKEGSGTVAVTVRSRSGYGTAAKVVARKSSASTSVPRSQLFDPSWSLPKADPRKLVLAAYYPWFSATGWDALPVAERPLDPRSVWSPEGVRSMTEQAKAHGVDGFAISWMGAEKNGEAFDVAAAAAVEAGTVVTPYLETTEALERGGVPLVEQWLREAVSRTGPASLRVDGVPVVFVWTMGKVSGSDWSAILQRLGQPVVLVGDADTSTHGSTMGGWHTYLPPVDLTGAADRNLLRSGWFRGQAALDTTLTPKLHVATVSPGFDDRALRGADRPVVSRDGGRYLATWEAALAGDPDMVLITSWNEWYEGSEIEPGTRWGTTALEETRVVTAGWKTSPTCGSTPGGEETATTDAHWGKRPKRG